MSSFINGGIQRELVWSSVKGTIESIPVIGWQTGDKEIVLNYLKGSFQLQESIILNKTRVKNKQKNIKK